MLINFLPIVTFSLIILVSYEQSFSLRRFISIINLSYNVNTLQYVTWFINRGIPMNVK